MTARTFAALFGGLYLAAGALGFVPPLLDNPPRGAPQLDVTVFYGSLFDIFAVNLILSMTHLVLGLWGTMAANNKYSALIFARAGAVIFAVLGIAGLVPVTEVNTVYGTMPLYGYNAWLHLATALIAAFFAYRPGYQLTQIGMREGLNPHAPIH